MRDQRNRLIFIDETGTTTKMTRARGRSVKGERLHAKNPFGHWNTQTLGSGLIDQIQKMTVAAIAIADMKVCAHRS